MLVITAEKAYSIATYFKINIPHMSHTERIFNSIIKRSRDGYFCTFFRELDEKEKALLKELGYKIKYKDRSRFNNKYIPNIYIISWDKGEEDDDNSQRSKDQNRTGKIKLG